MMQIAKLCSLIITVCLFLPHLAWSAVSNVTHVAATPGTGTSATISITVSGTNPVLVIGVAMKTTTDSISSVTWSQGGGSCAIVVPKQASSEDARDEVWNCIAPNSGAGTITINFTGSVPYQADAGLFAGADQTTPCPVSDAQTLSTTNTTETLTPTNLTANDATFGSGALTIGGSPTGMTPNALYTNNTTSVNEQTGYATGTTGVTYNWTGATKHAMVAVRIVAAGSSPSAAFYMRRIQ